MISAEMVGSKIWHERRRYVGPCLFVLLGLIVLQTIPFGSLGWGGQNNLHVYQALAFLQGRVDLPQYYLDTALYNGRYYVPFPPFPAVVLLPFVAIFGASTRVVLISAALTVLNVIVLTRLFRKLDIESRFVRWLVAAFFLGTPYWSAVRGSHGVWFFSHLVAVTCILLAINEVVGKGRGLVAGLFLGMAFLSRQLTIYSIIFLGVALWEYSNYKTRKERLGKLALFLVAVSSCVGVYLAYNWLRFDNVLDTGYSRWVLVDPFMAERARMYGSFHPVYLPHNFVYMFIQGFHLEFTPPYLETPRLDPFGTSLTFASPFVFIALLARCKRNLLWGAWLSIGLCLAHMLFYFGNGWVQENGQRYTLDFFPVLMVLVAFGVRNVEKKLWKASIVYSIGLNFLALFLISYVFGLYYRVLEWGGKMIDLATRILSG